MTTQPTIRFHRRGFTIASHLVCAIEYGDYTALDDDDSAALDAFMAHLPPGPGHWAWTNSEEFARDDVTGLLATCVDAVYLWRVAA